MRHFISLQKRFAPVCLMLLLCRGLLPGAGLSESVDAAVARGRQWLLGALERREFSHQTYPMGIRSLYLYALLKAGADPAHPAVKRELDTIMAMAPNQTYSVSLHLMALDQWARGRGSIRLLKADAQQGVFSFLGEKTPRAQQLVDWLVQAKATGQAHWTYTRSRSGHDYSNSQFAILGLEIGLRNNLTVPAAVWTHIGETYPKTMAKPQSSLRKRVRISLSRYTGDRGRTVVGRVLTIDRVPNGWGYHAGSNPTFSMTCAGLSNLAAARWGLEKKGLLNKALQQAIDAAMQQSMVWIAVNWSSLTSLRPAPKKAQRRYYYTVYSLEKAGDLAEVGKFGDHDWYDEEARFLLQDQRSEGFWGDHNWRGVATSFALLFLNRATARFHPVKDIVVTTGRGSRPDEAAKNDELVYIDELDGYVSMGAVLCALLNQSDRTLLRIAGKAVDRFAPGQKSRLVPSLIILAGSGIRETERFARSHLTKITGRSMSQVSHYWKWVDHWKEVRSIVQAAPKPDVQRLCVLARESPWESIQVMALAGIEKLNAAEAMPQVIECLADKSLLVRQKAYACLRFLGCTDIAFSPDGRPELRQRAMDRIKIWYAQTGQAMLKRRAISGALYEILAAPPPGIPEGAVKVLSAQRDAALALLMAKLEDRFVDYRVYTMLRRLSGKDFGLLPGPWLGWWREENTGEKQP